MGLGPLSIYVSVAQWRYAIFGLGPLQIYAAVGLPPPSEAMHVTDGRIYCRHLAPWGTRWPMNKLWGWVPCGARQLWGRVPRSSVTVYCCAVCTLMLEAVV